MFSSSKMIASARRDHPICDRAQLSPMENRGGMKNRTLWANQGESVMMSKFQ